MTRPALLGSFAVLLAGLAGAAGVSVFAAAAHVAEAGSREQFALSNAAIMLMVHAAAAIALCAYGDAAGRVAWRWQALALALVAGALLFGGAVALPKFAGVGLFPMAAPIGGSLTIGVWFLIGLNALVELAAGRGSA